MCFATYQRLASAWKVTNREALAIHVHVLEELTRINGSGSSSGSPSPPSFSDIFDCVNDSELYELNLNKK